MLMRGMIRRSVGFERPVTAADPPTLSITRIFMKRISPALGTFALVTCLAAAAVAKDITMGFIYVGAKDDYGYNQVHAAGKEGVSEMPGVETVEEAQGPEAIAGQETMRSMTGEDGG